MKKTVRLTESELKNIINRIITEAYEGEIEANPNPNQEEFNNYSRILEPVFYNLQKDYQQLMSNPSIRRIMEMEHDTNNSATNQIHSLMNNFERVVSGFKGVLYSLKS